MFVRVSHRRLFLSLFLSYRRLYYLSPPPPTTSYHISPPPGLQLYLLLVEVFEAERSRLKWYSYVAYGAPALVVLVSAAVDPFSYGSPQVCWLRTDNYFIFAFVGPVAAVLLVSPVKALSNILIIMAMS